MADQFHGHKKVLSIYNGFEIPQIKTEISISEELQQGLNQADLVLGCTSRIRLIRKGQEYLIEAIGILTQKTGKNIQAILIGDYVPGYEWQKENITSLIKKYHLENRIHFLGHLTNPLPYYKLFGSCSSERIEKYFSLDLHKDNIQRLYEEIIDD